MRSAWLLIPLLLACCARPPAPPAPAPFCRLGPDGGMPVADRGIGGTGVMADRGIGGTGIIGVITGFASVCLGGEEVGFDSAVPVQIDGQPGVPGALRAGQVAAIEAAPGLRARSIMVRHEVIGPVDAARPGDTFRVAGQRVIPAEGAWGALPRPGEWIEVSGFRQGDGSIVATRLDPHAPGEALVRGVMAQDGGRLRIGTLEIRPAPGQFVGPGVPVLAIGRLRDGVLFADTVEPDVLATDPVLYFGGRVRTLIFEAYAEGGFVRLGGRRFAAPFAQGRALARLERQADGGYAPAFVRGSGTAGYAPMGMAPRTFEPAPVPNRAMDRAGARGDAHSGGPGGGGRRGGRAPGAGGGAGSGGPR